MDGFILLMSIIAAGALVVALALVVRELINIDAERWAEMNYGGMGMVRHRGEWRRLL